MTSVDSAAALSTKRKVLDSYGAKELDGFLDAKGSQLEWDTKADQSATVVALSFKQDKAGSYTAAETP